MLLSSINRTKHCVGAFTLIEVLVATTILSAGIVGVVGAFSLSNETASRVSRASDAAGIAQRTLELAIALTADKLEPAEGYSGQFTWQLIYSQKPHGLMMASVSVDWLEKGQLETYELSQVFLPKQ